MPFSSVNLPEYLLSSQDFIVAQITKITVGAIGFESLILLYFRDYKLFDPPISVHQTDFLPHCKLGKKSTRQIIVRKQTYVPELGRHAELSNYAINWRNVIGIAGWLLNDWGS